MSRMRKRPANTTQARIQLYRDLEEGNLDIATALKRMREIAGKTQPDYAKLIGVAPRVLIDIERGVGNPTLKTLQKLGEPFGLKVTYLPRGPRPKRAPEPSSE